MEHITQNRTFPRWERPTLSFKLPLYQRCVLVLLAGFTVIASGTQMILAQTTTVPRENPFAAFADIFLGQPRSAIEAGGFTCPVSSFGGSTDEHCIMSLKSNVFSSAGVDIVDNVIHYITFNVRKNTLRVGDLVLLWGMPEIVVRGRQVLMRWHQSSIFAAATSYTGKFSPRLPVTSVSIAQTGCNQC